MSANHYGASAKSRPIPTCPKCGKTAKEVQTRYGLRNSCCDLWSWDRYPLVSAETHAARNAAHKAFDALWKQKLVSRGDAYRLLRDELGISKDDCHMKLMDEATALRVPPAVEAIRARVVE